MSGLIGRFTTLLRRRRPSSPRTTSDELPLPPKRTPSWAPIEALRARDDRRALIEDCRAMRRSDPRAAGVIGTVARDAVRGGVRVEVRDGPDAARAQESADSLLRRVRLNHRLDDFLRMAFTDGDLFLEHSVDDGAQVVALTRKPTLEMNRASDRSDRFADPARAYWLGESWDGEPPKDAIWLADWQITHARWDHDDGSRYGRPLFAAARTAHKRLTEGEFDVAVRRKTRSGLRYVHKLVGARPEQVEEYKRMNQDVLNDPFAALADFFVNFEGGIEAVQGDANLHEIGDVLHHLRTWAISAPVPLPLLGYGEHVNRDVLERQQQQYDRALMEITSWAIGDIVTPIVELQWLLDGIWPSSLGYTIAPPTTEVLVAASLRDAADAAIKLRAAGLPPDLLWPVVARLIPGLDAQQVIAAIAAADLGDPSARLASESVGGIDAARSARLAGLLAAVGRGAA